MSGGFDEAAVPGHRASFCADAAVGFGRAVRPDDDCPAVSAGEGIGLDARFGSEVSGLCIPDIGVFPLVVAAREDRSASRFTGGVDLRRIHEPHLPAEEVDRAALAAAPLRLDGARHQGRAFRRLHGDLPPLWAIGRGHAVLIERDVLRRPEVNSPCFVHDRAVGFDDPAVPDEPSIDADPARFRDDLAEVQGLVLGCADDGGDFGRRALDQADLLAGGQHDVAVGRVEDAAVGHVRRDQVDASAGRGSDGPLIFDRAGKRPAAEVDFPGPEIAVRDVERGGDQAVDVDRGGGADEDALLVDQVNPAVGLEGSVDGARVVAYDPVQDGARGGGLDETRELAARNGEVLPVDDRPVAVGDGKGLPLGGEAGLSADHLRPERVGNRRLGDQDPQQQGRAEPHPQTLQPPHPVDRIHGFKPPVNRTASPVCESCYPPAGWCPPRTANSARIPSPARRSDCLRR